MDQALNFSPNSLPPKKPAGSALQTPSLERFFPYDDPELGITASAISPEAVARHYKRYETLAHMILPYVSKSDIVMDVGCGSGYGAAILGSKFRYVLGIEPNDLARDYATKHFPEIKFIEDMEGGDVVVMVESLEHMTKSEFRCYIWESSIVGVTTPLIEHALNEFHIQSFKEPEDVRHLMQRERLILLEEHIDKNIEFTTGEKGDQYYGIFGRLRGAE